jgi:hypothetical protein
MARDVHLVDERERYLRAMDDAYPDVGMGLLPRAARAQAIAQLKRERKIPQDYTEP